MGANGKINGALVGIFRTRSMSACAVLAQHPQDGRNERVCQMAASMLIQPCHEPHRMGAIGGVAAFDPDKGGVVSAGGVGFDISCGVRTMLTGLKISDVLPVQKSLAASLFRQIPAGVGSTGASRSMRLRWMQCWREALVGPSSAGGARPATSSASRKRAGWRGRNPNTFPSAPRSDSGARWARSVRAITTLRSRS